MQYNIYILHIYIICITCIYDIIYIYIREKRILLAWLTASPNRQTFWTPYMVHSAAQSPTPHPRETWHFKKAKGSVQGSSEIKENECNMTWLVV